MSDRAARGAGAFATGLAAEEAVAAKYAARGATVLARRWRSGFGEADLVVRDGDAVVVVEVKKARTLDEAAARLTRRQMDRLCAAAEAWPEGGDRRLDLALVDALGRVRIVENAFGADW